MVLKKQVLGLIMFSLMIVSVSLRASESDAASACQEKVSVFLTRPGKPSLTALSGSNEMTCWAIIGSSNTKLNQLNHWVEQANRWAAQYLAKHLKQLDGGNLEDALIALGQFSDHDMERLLLFANKGLLSKQELSDALTMLPLSLSDNPRAQLELLSTRRTKVMHVAQKDLSEQRAQALSTIDGFATEIRSKNPGND
jgi:hypothetical protein